MSTKRVQALTMSVALFIAVVINRLIEVSYDSISSSYVILLFFMLIMVLDLMVNKFRVSKKNVVEEIKWQKGTVRSPILGIAMAIGAFILGVLVYILIRPEGINGLFLAFYFLVVLITEKLRRRSPMMIYEDGIYVNGYFAWYDEIMYDKGIEKGVEYINVRVPNGLFVKGDIRVVGEEEIEKFERVVGKTKGIGL